MNKLKAMETFVRIATLGSMSAAARVEGVTPAVIGRRMNRLEAHLGVKLLVRTTRRLALTDEGTAFLDDCQRILVDVAEAESSVAQGNTQVIGHLRITAPGGFGRQHVAPLVPQFHALHPRLEIALNLSDRVMDLSSAGYDCAIRIGDLPDSSLVATRLADNQRLVVAAPAYLRRRGTPGHPRELARHDCLGLVSGDASTQTWSFQLDGRVTHWRPTGALQCSDGEVLHRWCLTGHGLAWRSSWEVDADVAAGRLMPVLQAYAAAPNGVFAVMPHASRQAPLRVRLWLDYLKSRWANPRFWMEGEAAGENP